MDFDSEFDDWEFGECGGDYETPAHQAAAEGDTHRLVSAVKHDPGSIQQKDNEGFTPLILAVMGKHLHSVKRLVKMGANIDAKDAQGRTSLAISAYQGWSEGMVYLLRKGARQDVADKSGRTPLHAATYNTDTKSLVTLLKRLDTETINVGDNEKMSALHWAAFHDRPDHVRQLLLTGATPILVDIDGKTPLHWATQNGSRACVEVFLKCWAGGQMVGMVDNCGKTAVHLAAAAGHTDILLDLACVALYLCEEGDQDDRTPLHWAAATGHVMCVRALLKLGVAPYPRDVDAVTPLEYATNAGHTDCKMLLENSLRQPKQNDRWSDTWRKGHQGQMTDDGFYRVLFPGKKPCIRDGPLSRNLVYGDSDVSQNNSHVPSHVKHTNDDDYHHLPDVVHSTKLKHEIRDQIGDLMKPCDHSKNAVSADYVGAKSVQGNQIKLGNTSVGSPLNNEEHGDLKHSCADGYGIVGHVGGGHNTVDGQSTVDEHGVLGLGDGEQADVALTAQENTLTEGERNGRRKKKKKRRRHLDSGDPPTFSTSTQSAETTTGNSVLLPDQRGTQLSSIGCHRAPSLSPRLSHNASTDIFRRQGELSPLYTDRSVGIHGDERKTVPLTGRVSQLRHEHRHEQPGRSRTPTPTPFSDSHTSMNGRLVLPDIAGHTPDVTDVTDKKMRRKKKKKHREEKLLDLKRDLEFHYGNDMTQVHIDQMRRGGDKKHHELQDDQLLHCSHSGHSSVSNDSINDKPSPLACDNNGHLYTRADRRLCQPQVHTVTNSNGNLSGGKDIEDCFEMMAL